MIITNQLYPENSSFQKLILLQVVTIILQGTVPYPHTNALFESIVFLFHPFPIVRYVSVSWRAILQVSLTKINFGKNSSCFSKFPQVSYWTSIKNNHPSFPPKKIRFSESLVGGFSSTHFKNMQPSNFVKFPRNSGWKNSQDFSRPKKLPPRPALLHCQGQTGHQSHIDALVFSRGFVPGDLIFPPQKKGGLEMVRFFCLVHFIWQSVESLWI